MLKLIYKSVPPIYFNRDGKITYFMSEGGCVIFAPAGRMLEKGLADIINMLVRKLHTITELGSYSGRELIELSNKIMEEQKYRECWKKNLKELKRRTKDATPTD